MGNIKYRIPSLGFNVRVDNLMCHLFVFECHARDSKTLKGRLGRCFNVDARILGQIKHHIARHGANQCGPVFFVQCEFHHTATTSQKDRSLHLDEQE
jgi:hypothetical protein